MLNLVIESDRTEPLVFNVQKMINAGLISRDQTVAQKHLDEIRKEGISVTIEKTPAFLPKVRDRITTSDTIEVLAGSKTCGEIEPVLLIGENNTIYVAVGSDHSDRELEKHNMIASKQMYPNVISKKVWRYQDVKGHWDDLILRGWVVETNGKRQLYQEGKLGGLMTVEDFLDKVKGYFKIDLTGTVIFMGTLPSLSGKFIYTPGFEAELVDEHAGRTLTCAYSIAPMTWFKYGEHTPRVT